MTNMQFLKPTHHKLLLTLLFELVSASLIIKLYTLPHISPNGIRYCGAQDVGQFGGLCVIGTQDYYITLGILMLLALCISYLFSCIIILTRKKKKTEKK